MSRLALPILRHWKSVTTTTSSLRAQRSNPSLDEEKEWIASSQGRQLLSFRKAAATQLRLDENYLRVHFSVSAISIVQVPRRSATSAFPGRYTENWRHVARHVPRRGRIVQHQQRSCLRHIRRQGSEQGCVGRSEGRQALRVARNGAGQWFALRR